MNDSTKPGASTSAWELAWREEFPNSARLAHYDGVAAAKRSGFEAGYLAAAAKLSPGPAGSATQIGDTAETLPVDTPQVAPAGNPGGLGGHVSPERAALKAKNAALLAKIQAAERAGLSWQQKAPLRAEALEIDAQWKELDARQARERSLLARQEPSPT